MKITDKRLALTIVGLSIAFISSLNCYTSLFFFGLNLCFNRLYAIPVVYATLVFGFKGGLITAILATISIWVSTILGFHIVNFNNTVLEISLFFILAWFVSYYIEKEKEVNKQLQAQEERIDRLEVQMSRAEKLSSLGTLVAGIAHEIRNPLSIIQISTESLARQGLADKGTQRFIEVILEETDRLNQIIEEFLDFSRPTKGEFDLVDINQVLDEVFFLTRKFLEEKKVKLIASLDSNLETVEGIRDQLKQVFINLILNAVEAMEYTELRNLEVFTKTEEDYISIIFSDTGCGIANEDLKKIYDPFFTTKDEGSGLGLSTVHRLVDLHNGFIKVDSELDKGTTFKIYLPLRSNES